MAAKESRPDPGGWVGMLYFGFYQRTAHERGQTFHQLVFIQRGADVDAHDDPEHRPFLASDRYSFWRGGAGAAAQTRYRVRFSGRRPRLRRAPGGSAKRDPKNLGVAPALSATGRGHRPGVA